MALHPDDKLNLIGPADLLSFPVAATSTGAISNAAPSPELSCSLPVPAAFHSLAFSTPNTRRRCPQPYCEWRTREMIWQRPCHGWPARDHVPQLLLLVELAGKKAVAKISVS